MSRKRNPFSDLVGSDDSEDDFVDFDDLPPLPEKSLPKPNIEDFPKQKINKTRSQAQRIGKISKERESKEFLKELRIANVYSKDQVFLAPLFCTCRVVYTLWTVNDVPGKDP